LTPIFETKLNQLLLVEQLTSSIPVYDCEYAIVATNYKSFVFNKHSPLYLPRFIRNKANDDNCVGKLLSVWAVKNNKQLRPYVNYLNLTGKQIRGHLQKLVEKVLSNGDRFQALLMSPGTFVSLGKKTGQLNDLYKIYVSKHMNDGTVAAVPMQEQLGMITIVGTTIGMFIHGNIPIIVDIVEVLKEDKIESENLILTESVINS